MRNEFLEHYVPSETEFAEMWTNGLIIFDTNSLLRLFRYRETTVQQIFEILEAIPSRIWCPYQIAWEYQRNRFTKIQEAESSFQAAMKDFETAHTASSNRLRGLQDFGIHPKLRLDGKVAELSKFVEDSITDIRKEYSESPLADYFNQIHDRLGRFYIGKLGSEPSPEVLDRRIEEARQRTAAGAPPGFIDAKEKQKDKSNPDRSVFGDVLLWFEILEYATTNKKDVIFVTEDNKEDWWKKENGKTIGALPELRREYRKNTGRSIYFYNVSRFLENAKKYLKINVSEESVADAKKNAVELIPLSMITSGPEFLVDIGNKQFPRRYYEAPEHQYELRRFHALDDRRRSLQGEIERLSMGIPGARSRLMQFPIEERRASPADMKPDVRRAHTTYLDIRERIKHLENELQRVYADMGVESSIAEKISNTRLKS
ncbi:hypothetical protein ABIE45_004393 [Methylobacterium sp. OAE515]|uniref:PIN domain-containing protein n=1 Tax=Methylobacterium sp. OAE515 TaxID=2817895 RepID=UPI00178987C2